MSGVFLKVDGSIFKNTDLTDSLLSDSILHLQKIFSVLKSEYSYTNKTKQLGKSLVDFLGASYFLRESVFSDLKTIPERDLNLYANLMKNALPDINTELQGVVYKRVELENIPHFLIFTLDTGVATADLFVRHLTKTKIF